MSGNKRRVSERGGTLMGFLVTMDGNLLLWIQKHARFNAWNFFWIAVTSLGNAGIVWLLLSAALLFQRRTREAGQAALLSMGLCFLLCNVILKNLVARTRPYEVIPELTTLIPHPTDYSFPSGHTSASFACALVLFAMLPKKYGVLILCLAALIALSRLYVGVHYPSDVLGGMLVAVAVSVFVLWLWKRR